MDIDIDFPTNFDPLDVFPNAVRASNVNDKRELIKHNVGIYFQRIAKDKVTHLAALPYKEAEKAGFFKIDFLHLSTLDIFESKQEIRTLLRTEPDWTLLQSAVVVKKLFQIHKHYDLLTQIKPQSVQELADCLALIRPAKVFLIKHYLKDKEAVRRELYKKPDDGRPYFKKAHAISYALTIVLQLHLVKGKVL